MASRIIKGKNKNKPYTVRYTNEGRQREISFVTLREARDWKVKFEHDRREETFIDPRASVQTFGEAARDMIRNQRTRNTREAYEGCLVHLDEILNRPLRAVAQDRDGVRALCANHPQGKRMLSVIRNVCIEAVNSGRLNSHRLAGLRCNRVSQPRSLIIATPAQLDQMTVALKSDGLILAIMRLTGVRVSEALALKREDFVTTVDGGTVVHVSRQIQHGETVPLKHRRDFTGRQIPVTPSLARLVSARPAGPLFSCSYRSFLDRFQRAARKAGLPKEYSPHQTRHAFASTLLAGGISLTDVARWLGDEIRTVGAVYAHLLPGQTDRALALLESDYTGSKAQNVA